MMMWCACGGELVVSSTDSRQEWCEEMMDCKACDKTYTHRTEFNQSGLVESDTLEEL